MNNQNQKRTLIITIISVLVVALIILLILLFGMKTYNIITDGNLLNVIASTDNPSSIKRNETKTLKFSASSGYVLPDNITVSGAESVWNKNEGELVISNPTSDVSISISALRQYSITPSLENVSGNQGNPTTIVEDNQLVIYFTASDDYSLPEEITVTGSDYTWDKETGKLTIKNPTGNISYSIVATPIIHDYDMSGVHWEYTNPFTYDGTEKTITVTGLPEGVTVKSYSNNKMTNAGSYTASVTFNYDSVHYNEPTLADCSWTINKATAEINTSGVTTNFVYTGQEQVINSGATLNHSETTLVYSNNKFTNVGSGSYTITISANETTNYKAISTNVTISVSKATSSINTAGLTTSFVYDGTQKSISGATLNNTEQTITYEDNNFTTVGSYIVTIKAVETANYNAISTTINVSITKATYVMTGASWNYSSPFTYDGNEKSVTVTGLPTGVTVKSYSDNKKTDAGSYTASVTFTYDTTNYNEPTMASCSWIISKATPTVTAPTAKTSLTYAGSSLNLVNAGSTSGGSLVYALTSTNTAPESTLYSLTIPSATDAGTYYVWYKVNGNSNYNDVTSQNTVVKIGKATQSITNIGDISKTYDGSAVNDPTYNKLGNGTVTVQYKVSTADDTTYSTTKPINAGTYTVKVSVAEGTSHLSGSETKTFTISKASYVMTGASWNYSSPFTYDGNEKSVTVTGLPTGVTVKSYSDNKKTGAGSYTASVTFTYDTTNYNEPTMANCSWTINKTTQSITNVSDLSKTYDGNAVNDPTYNKLGNGTVTVQYKVSTADDTTYSTTKPINVGTYTVKVSVAEGTNHLSGSETKSFTISKACYVMTGASWNYSSPFTYDGNEKSVTVTGLPTGVTVKSYSDNKKTDAGSYTASVTFTYDTTNYNEPTMANCSWIISKATPTVTAPTIKKSLHCTGSSLDLISAGSTSAGSLVYALTSTNTAPESSAYTSTIPSATNVGTYYVWYKVNGNTNYNDIAASSLEVKIYAGYSITFDTDFDICPDSDGYSSMNDISLKLTDNSIVKFSISQTGDDCVLLDENKAAVSFPYTIDDIKSITSKYTYVAYYKGSLKDMVYVHDFGDGALTLDSDITITELGRTNCIDENTRITMADGTTKAMKDVNVGDMVLSVDFETNTLVARKVIYSSNTEEHYDEWIVPCYYLHTFSDGTQIKRAMRHRFYNLESGTFKHLSTWTTGLHAYKLDGTNPELVSTEIVQGELHYARITLEGSNNYFANGLLTGDSEALANGTTVTLDQALQMYVSQGDK